MSERPGERSRSDSVGLLKPWSSPVSSGVRRASAAAASMLMMPTAKSRPAPPTKQLTVEFKSKDEEEKGDRMNVEQGGKRRVHESDGSFFESFTALSWKQENKRLQAAREDDTRKDKPPPREADVGISVAEFKIGKKEWENLYTEVLYTIKHKLGANCSSRDLDEYAQEAFHMSPENHRRLLAIALEEKPPIPVLNVVVVEAQGLEAKDLNGFSDPYCMLGIQPGCGSAGESGSSSPSRNKSSDEDDVGRRASPPRRQVVGLKKFSASFKRRDRRSSSSPSESLPAKLIRTTTVKMHTLNPKWGERFRLDFDDIHTDRLHLDIWDHDDESSFLDAARKLNQVTGLKGLGRYFKQVAQSARASTGDNVDDFLGCVNIPLDIPSAGIDQWYPLEGRSHRSTIQGQIRLKLRLGTREVAGVPTADSNHDNWKEVVEHQELLWIFIGHELTLLKAQCCPTYEWAGDLPQSAQTILHQHALHGNISEFQQAMCRWITYSRKHMEQVLDYALLYQMLKDLDEAWCDEQEGHLSRDEESALAESFDLFVDYCLELVRKHRDIFPTNNKVAEHKLFYLLSCVKCIHGMKGFQTCCPFRPELHLDVVTALKKGTSEWFTTTVAFSQPQVKCEQSGLRSLIELTNSLNSDLQRGALHYNQMFENTVKTNYSVVVYKHLENLLAAELMRKIQSKVEDKVRPQVVDACHKVGAEHEREDARTINITTAMFELYIALQEFVRFKENLPYEERKQMALKNFHLWFSDVVHQWFTLAKIKSRQRIQKALELDKLFCASNNTSASCTETNIDSNSPQKFTYLDNYVKHSTSAVDTTTCFVQIKEFWRQLAWPDPVGSYAFVMQIVECLCDGAIYYANISHHHLLNEAFYDAVDQFDMTEPLCITVNNIEHVRRALIPLPDQLDLEGVVRAVEQVEGQKGGEQCRTALYGIIRSSEEDVVNKILGIIGEAVERMRPEINKCIFHLSWAPEKCNADDAIGPLMKYLDSNLKTLYNNMMRANFDRVLEAIWTVVLQELTFTARSSIGKERQAFFTRLSNALSILTEFFFANEKGLKLETLQNPLYHDVEHLLKLHKSDTIHLVELYYLQRLEEQSINPVTQVAGPGLSFPIAPGHPAWSRHLKSATDTNEFGCLTVKVLYNHAAECLSVDVINARDLIPLDPNGFSDPFVIVELLPRHVFNDCPQQRTRIQKRTLFPFFDECFEFPVNVERCRLDSSTLCFTVMDHDVMTRNDFEGEAFLALSSIPGIGSEAARDAKPVELLLLRPKERNEILASLEIRFWDKEAQEFVKQHRNRHC